MAQRRLRMAGAAAMKGQVYDTEEEARQAKAWDTYLTEIGDAYAVYLKTVREAWAKAQRGSAIKPQGPALEPHPMFIGKPVVPP